MSFSRNVEELLVQTYVTDRTIMSFSIIVGGATCTDLCDRRTDRTIMSFSRNVEELLVQTYVTERDRQDNNVFLKKCRSYLYRLM